ncbi:tetratricopeptide repeat protein [Hyphobacterium marinum]|uniref:Tetratricopeptide repeat protein n=1 Tax=Hyphobacterium marinum TaxID=3116574 RepID=A0ABU7LXT6_9PROT|nr:tetratricopeptide repeat protein [Hyphobacterium sp. Y6023]MEE2566005.1 tetratricopeptide repeat protein [Hyphobacterium sp. Y6023]
MFRLIAFSTAALLLVSGEAAAQMTFIGREPAAVCYESALVARGDRESQRVCTLAIEDQFMTSEARARTHVNRGVVRIAARDFESALRDFESASRLAPGLAADIAANRAAALIHLGRHREALTEANYAIEHNARARASALFNRGVALEELGDMRGAYASYRQAAEARPGWSLPREALTRFQVMELT